MTSLVEAVVAQCPCSGGGSSGGMSQVGWLILFALGFGLWQAVRWTRATWNLEGTTKMARRGKITLVAALLAATGAFVGTRLMAADTAGEATAAGTGLPKLVDLGSKECVPCKMMAPILEDLRADYAGRFDVEFIDVGRRENAEAARRYGIKVIPTQIFLDGNGKELWRHDGFMDREAILAKWRELGYTFTTTGPAEAPATQAQQTPASSPASQPASAATQPSGTVAQAYPALTSGPLTHATLADLPAGTLLRAGEVTVSQADLDAEIAAAPENVRDQLRKNAVFLLEQTATRRLLLHEARAAAARDGKDASSLSEQELLQSLLAAVTADVTVTDADVAAFYAENREMVGGQPLEAVREAIAEYMRQEKQQEALAAYVEATGRRNAIEVDAAWVKRQAELAMDNPVDKARASGRPSLVDFGSHGCIPCDKLQPILAELRTKYDGRANVLFVSVREEQILASRYGVQSIPTLIFFDRDGKEVFRHTGFWPKDDLERKLAELGVK